MRSAHILQLFSKRLDYRGRFAAVIGVLQRQRHEGIKLAHFGAGVVSFTGKLKGMEHVFFHEAHHPDHIRKAWSQYFEVIKVRERVIDNIQDLMVLRR